MSDHHDHQHEHAHQHAKPMMCGGAGLPQPASEEAQKFLDEVRLGFDSIVRFFDNFFLQLRPQIEEKTNAKYQHFKAEQMRTQVVAGVNYFIKVTFNFYDLRK
jgi:hypothetical protein